MSAKYERPSAPDGEPEKSSGHVDDGDELTARQAWDALDRGDDPT